VGLQESVSDQFARVLPFKALVLDRVVYPGERMLKLADEAAAPQSALSVTDRMGLVQDAFANARAG
jgi:hypothetical protein